MRLDWIFLPRKNPCAKFYNYNNNNKDNDSNTIAAWLAQLGERRSDEREV